jgi:hypothetical protein
MAHSGAKCDDKLYCKDEVDTEASKLNAATGSLSPDSMKLEDICDRVRCSRCGRQIAEECMFRYNSRQPLSTTFEEATLKCAAAVHIIMETKDDLATLRILAIRVLHSLSSQQLAAAIEMFFHHAGHHRLASQVDEFSWLNMEPDPLTVHRGVLYLRYTDDMFIQEPELLERLIIRFVDCHPAQMMHQIEANVEPVWSDHLYPVNNARCFVDLTTTNFGRVVVATRRGLHKDGIHTFQKAQLLFHEMFLIYAALCLFCVDLTTQYAEVAAASTPVALLSIPTPSSLHVALQEALEAMSPARNNLEELISTTIVSADALVSDQADRTAWIGWSSRNERPDV